MKNKKSIMALSAINILVFHLWMNLTSGGGIELFLKQTAYLGVDIFFFLSGYSLAGREVTNYGSFVISRFWSVYFKFILFAVVAFFYAKWSFGYLAQVIFGINLVKKGGGAFLWFLPAIMIFYLLFPLFQKADKRNRWVTFLSVMVGWAVIAFVVSHFTDYSQMFIVWNRIPIFLLGYYFVKLDWLQKILESNLARFLCGCLLLFVGYGLIYLFAYKSKLQVPFVDTFYLMVIPASIGWALVASFIPEISVIKWIGSSTLEMYAMQMIFGYKLANRIMKQTKNVFFTNISTILLVIAMAVAVHYLYSYIEKKVKMLISR